MTGQGRCRTITRVVTRLWLLTKVDKDCSQQEQHLQDFSWRTLLSTGWRIVAGVHAKLPLRRSSPSLYVLTYHVPASRCADLVWVHRPQPSPSEKRATRQAGSGSWQTVVFEQLPICQYACIRPACAASAVYRRHKPGASLCVPAPGHV